MTYGSRRQDLEEIAEAGESMGGGARVLEGQHDGAPAPAVRRNVDDRKPPGLHGLVAAPRHPHRHYCARHGERRRDRHDERARS